ncbi:argininosuccinate lyase [Deinococcus altitudinis]|uniref:argininosuccinate lyase n=1 Tax=Deinococcus altitudinis TaxID=468914 RepID=UPI0038929804
MNWHPVYLSAVLKADYAFAQAHLLPHFLEALKAHSLGLLKVETPHAQAAVDGIQALRAFVAPHYDPAVEDLFFTLDRELSRHSPVGAGALRTALSRNDLDMTVYRLSARAHLMTALSDLSGLRRTLLELATRERGTLMVAFSHHQPAQPTTLGHYLLAVESALSRDTARLHGALERLNFCPLGAVAMTGSSHPLDRDYTARLLGFSGPIENTFDAVSAGDWQTELAGALSTCAVNLSRTLYDLLNWAAQGLLTLADGLVQGSSVMPQKRNPVALEHARTRFSKVLGYAQALTFSNHNVPYGDINDPGTDAQEPLWLMWQDFSQGVRLLSASLEDPQIDRGRWRELTEHSDTTLTELADTLARQTGDFRQAHAVAQALLKTLHTDGRSLQQATDDDVRALGVAVADGTVAAALNPDAFVQRRTTLGGPAPEPLRVQTERAELRLRQDTAQQATWQAGFDAAEERLWTVKTL